MKKVLILYPPEFKCQSKFDRKIANIVSRLEDFSIIFPEDPNHFIQDFFHAKSNYNLLSENKNWAHTGITHAIIFDDGEIFTEESKEIQNSEAQLRLIKIKITRVINIKADMQYAEIKNNPSYEYIGRGSNWGNPHVMFSGENHPEEGASIRDEVIRKYKYDFDRNLLRVDKSEVLKLAGKRLGCFCKPFSCHGDILSDYLNRWDDGK